MFDRIWSLLERLMSSPPESLNTQSSAFTSKSNVNGLAGLLSAVLAQTSNIQASDNGVDSKAHNLMAAALVIVALLATQLKHSGAWDWLTVIAMAVLIADVCAIMYMTRAQKFDGAVVDLGKHQEYFQKDDELLLAQLIEDANKANDRNTVIIEEKKKWLRVAVYVFLIGFALAITSLFIS